MMMQFKGQKQNEIFFKVEEAINRVNQAQDEHSIFLSRADLAGPLSISSLEEHLKTHIDNCDFCIAEISQLNPNVMFEFGYAVGIEKPVIIMVQKGIRVPDDFSGRLYFEYKLDEIELIPQRLRGFIEGAIDKLVAVEQKSIYSIKAFENRNISDLIVKIKCATDRIEILTTNLTSFINANLHEIVRERLTEIKGLRVRILTLDPESEFASKRARQMGASTRSFREELKSSLEKASNTLNSFPDRCQISLYDEFPTQMTYIVDDNVYVNTISANQYARNNVVFKLKSSNPGVSKSIIGHYDTVWGRSSVFHRINT